MFERDGFLFGRWGAAAIAAASLLAPCSRASQPDHPAPVVAQPPPAEVIADVTAPEADRVAAAATLIAQADRQGVREILARFIAEPLAPASGGTLVLRAIARAPAPSARLYPVLADRLGRATPAERPAILAALSSFRTRDAARLILAQTDTGDAVVAGAAYAALERLSGRADLDDDRAAWWAWLERADAMSESQWRTALAEAHAARADELGARVAGLSSELRETLRRLFLATPAEQRSAFLAGLLLDDRAIIRDVGFELIARELSASGRVNGPVGEAVVRLLTHQEAPVRARAATLVRQLAPPGAEDPVATALLKERDPVAAAELLLAAARWGQPRVVEPVLAWAESSTPARDQAIEASLALWRAGVLQGDDLGRVLRVARSRSDGDLTPAAVALLCLAGEAGDRDRCAVLLRGEPGPLRQAAARSLVWDAPYLDGVLGAAAGDPSLFEVAARGALLHEPTDAMYLRVAALPAPTPEAGRTALLRLARALPATDLLRVVGATTDPTMQESLLELLTIDTRVMSEASAPANAAAIAEGAARLAMLHLARGEAAQALAVLDGAPFAAELRADDYRFIRCSALVALGRLREAAEAEGSCDAWLRGLEIARGTPHARAVADAIEARFGELSAEQRQRLTVERAALVSTGPEEPARPR